MVVMHGTISNSSTTTTIADPAAITNINSILEVKATTLLFPLLLLYRY